MGVLADGLLNWVGSLSCLSAPLPLFCPMPTTGCVYWPLTKEFHPCNAIGLEVDWGEGLDTFALLSSAADAASKQETAYELLQQLEALLAADSGRHSALLVWTYFIQAIEK